MSLWHQLTIQLKTKQCYYIYVFFFTGRIWLVFTFSDYMQTGEEKRKEGAMNSLHLWNLNLAMPMTAANPSNESPVGKSSTRRKYVGSGPSYTPRTRTPGALTSENAVNCPGLSIPAVLTEARLFRPDHTSVTSFVTAVGKTIQDQEPFLLFPHFLDLNWITNVLLFSLFLI